MTDLLSRVEAEIAAGRAWRAKEILRGNFADRWPDAQVVERYGQLLLQVGEDLEAGKYLFASGMRKPEYERPIALFIARHGRVSPDNLVAQLPTSFRHQPFDALPAIVQRDLRDRGVRENGFGSREKVSTHPVTLYDRFMSGVAVVIGLVLFVSLRRRRSGIPADRVVDQGVVPIRTTAAARPATPPRSHRTRANTPSSRGRPPGGVVLQLLLLV